MIKEKEEIINWLNKKKIFSYSLIENDEYGFIVDVNNSVILHHENLKFIPIKFNKVSGRFMCNGNKLKTLKGCPESVGYDFICNNNELTSLEFAPKQIGGNLDFSYNQLTDLKSFMSVVQGSINCSYNNITSLLGAPEKVFGSFNCSHNQLHTLKYSPKEVIEFYCNDNHIKSLEDISDKIESNINIAYNKIEKLEHLPAKIKGWLECSHNMITSLENCPEAEHLFCNFNLLQTIDKSPNIKKTIEINFNELLTYICDEALEKIGSISSKKPKVQNLKNLYVLEDEETYSISYDILQSYKNKKKLKDKLTKELNKRPSDIKLIKI